MFWIFCLSCSSQRDVVVQQSKPSQKVQVDLDPKIGGDIEVSFDDLDSVVTGIQDFTDVQKQKLWSILHLIQSPCSIETLSVLSSIQKGSCLKSQQIANRAIQNIDKPDQILVDLLTFPDFWFSAAKQGENQVCVELWLEKRSLDWSQLEANLNILKNAQLRICDIDTHKEILSNQTLPLGQNMSLKMLVTVKNDSNTSSCSSELAQEVRSSPTWFVEGFRLRGLQSAIAIQRLIDFSLQDKIAP